jgi:hypothetical protein
MNDDPYPGSRSIPSLDGPFSGKMWQRLNKVARKCPAFVAASTLLLLAVPGEASTIGGEMGNVSRATIGISLSVAPRVQLMRVGKESTSKTAGQSILRAQALCIWGNTPLGTYNVTALIDASQGFVIKNGSAHGINYSVEWQSSGHAPGPVSLSSGSALQGLTADRSVRCGGRATAGLVVRLPGPIERNADRQHAGTLLLLVAPD